jgi:hypothetical protein
MSLAAQIEIWTAETVRRQRVKIGAFPCGGDTGKSAGSAPEMLPWIGVDEPLRTAGKD